MSPNNLIGKIVALKSHPFTETTQSIIISGEAQHLSPLMVVVEVLKDGKKLFDENTGEQLSSPEDFQCKCVWFSHKTQQFEEQWIPSRLLKEIAYDSGPALNNSQLENSQVCFKTLDIEMGKVKSSLTYNDESTASGKAVLTPLLSFVSPVMEVFDIKKNNSKEAKFDTKTGDVKRILPSYMVKCKWYNSITEKVTEAILPIEALTLAKPVDKELFTNIQAIINAGKFYKYEGKIFKPESIVYRAGKYYIRGYDYNKNDNEDLDILTDLTVEDRPFLETAPTNVASRAQEDRDNNVIALLRVASDQKNHIRIKYRNQNGVVTVRTVSKLVLDPSREAPKHVIGYCHLRKAERMFAIREIQNVQQLNMSYE